MKRIIFWSVAVLAVASGADWWDCLFGYFW